MEKQSDNTKPGYDINTFVDLDDLFTYQLAKKNYAHFKENNDEQNAAESLATVNRKLDKINALGLSTELRLAIVSRQLTSVAKKIENHYHKVFYNTHFKQEGTKSLEDQDKLLQTIEAFLEILKEPERAKALSVKELIEY